MVYLELPAGPTNEKFADDKSNHSTCKKCGRLSMSMYRDPGNHKFCQACLRAQIDQRGKDIIHCEDKSKDIYQIESMKNGASLDESSPFVSSLKGLNSAEQPAKDSGNRNTRGRLKEPCDECVNWCCFPFIVICGMINQIGMCLCGE